jgi:uncharacterized protein with von Willebrand factor type A (vWA) domain
MLPYVDDFLPVHNLESLKQLASTFQERHTLRGLSRRGGSTTRADALAA